MNIFYIALVVSAVLLILSMMFSILATYSLTPQGSKNASGVSLLFQVMSFGAFAFAAYKFSANQPGRLKLQDPSKT